MTSNPTIHQGRFVHVQDYWALKGQVERLTAELQGTKDELYSVDKAAKELGAERDRYQLGAHKLAHQVDRLRAALGRISQFGGDRVWAQQVAAEALAGVHNHSGSLPVGGQSHTEVNRQRDETKCEHGLIGLCPYCLR